MKVRLLLPTLVLVAASICCSSIVRAQEEWEQHRDRYAHWLDNQWQEQPIAAANPAPPTTTSWQLQRAPMPQQSAYRHHANYGIMGPYYPRTIAPAGYGPYRSPAKFVPSTLHGSYNYQPLLDEDNFCNILGINPLDCTGD